MAMTVVDVRIVWMAVHQWLVLVVIGMWFAPVPGEIVRVLVMRVVRMRVAVLMAFGEVQPHAGQDKRRRGPEQSGVSWTAISDRPAPMKGAVEKYAPVRAVPISRSARTNSARLMP